ncbi:MAG: membrane-bound lytic murein transglycosylase MltF [Desulfobacterales bacterium]|nr:membrane-bound lytic murein transglycosylase MltF [Desulfobacterales bacterium]
MVESADTRTSARAWATLGRTALVCAYLASCVAFVFFTRPRPTALDRIRQFGELTVITRNNANCYYLYRDTPMGFEYDLAKSFADHLQVRLQVRVADNWQALVEELAAQPDAVIAASLAITPARRQLADFSDGYMAIRQHIIVNRSNMAVKRAEDLAGREVHVRRGSPYQQRLELLQSRGIAVNIVLQDDTPTEELIQEVSSGEIDITIADSHIARLNRQYYPRAVLGPPIGEEVDLGWAVHPRNRTLLSEINRFFKTIKRNGTYDRIYNRYYANIDSFDYVDLRIFHRRVRTRLPRYRPVIETAAQENGFDWRLIAAQIYQESHFNPRAESHAGAFGLMQLTARTARSLGVKDPFDPTGNIRAGIRHLKALHDRFDQVPVRDRMTIALAAYNVGQGHIHDARRLAKRLGLDPNRWTSLTQTLPMLRQPKYYKEARYGYCRGTEPVIYVRKIALYYDILKHKSLAENHAAPFVAP